MRDEEGGALCSVGSGGRGHREGQVTKASGQHRKHLGSAATCLGMSRPPRHHSPPRADQGNRSSEVLGHQAPCSSLHLPAPHSYLPPRSFLTQP